jgi:stringent starvation protein B
MTEVDYNNLKPLDIKKSKGKFKTFTNGSVIQEAKFQPYLGKSLTINIDKILSVYPSEDGIGTSIHAEHNQSTWKVLEDFETVIKRISE